MPETSLDLKSLIRDIPDFPKPGINFKDITPLLRHGEGLASAVRQMASYYRDANVDVIVAAEARGFVFAAPMAIELGIGFVPIRKPGKLPFDRHTYSYDLEYGNDTLEMHIDGVGERQNVLIVDDLLATGGTVGACIKMVENCKANIVGCCFLIELAFLGGAAKLAPYPCYSLIRYE